jgi:hypothetical protein
MLESNTDEVVPLIESEDYYLDHGLMVLTASYHLRRGYCCDQGCRHCPYPETQKGNRKVDIEGNETTR